VLISRFGLAGAVNTLAGFAVIAALDLGLGVESRIANAVGYGVGLLISFLLNRMFVFKSVERARATGPRFLAAAAFAFLINQAVLSLIIGLLGSADKIRLLAQLLAMTAYTGTMFVLCTLWVFHEPQSPNRPKPDYT
jgi:putative flippase GtrA